MVIALSRKKDDPGSDYSWRDIHLFVCAADGDAMANRAMHALKGRALAESFRDYSS